MAEKTRSAEVMMNLIQKMSLDDIKNPQKIQEAKEEAIKTTDAIYKQDKMIYRIAICILGSLTIISAIGSIILVGIGKTTPETLIALGATAVGALVGLFATSSSK